MLKKKNNDRLCANQIQWTSDGMNTNSFPVVILAGGLATRLRPLTETIPKALIKVNNEPFINHQLRLLSRHGIREVVLCVGYLGEMIEDYLGNGHKLGVNIQYSYDGKQLLGTAGAIKKALPILGESFFVLYGDSYLACDYSAVKEAYTKLKKPGLMTVFRNLGQWDTSNIEYFDGEIVTYDKKNPSKNMHYIDYGLGIFSKQAFTIVPEKESYDLTVLYQTLLARKQLSAYEVHKRFYEIGSFAGIKELEYYLKLNELAFD